MKKIFTNTVYSVKPYLLPFGYLYPKQLIAMFSGISWYGYLYFLALVSSAYYLVVFTIFYRKEIIFWFKKVQRIDTRDSFLFDRMDSAEILKGDNAVENLQTAIMGILNEGVNRELIEQEIISSLELLLTNHNNQLMPPQRNRINEYVIRECKNICSIHLDEEKVVRLWLSKR